MKPANTPCSFPRWHSCGRRKDKDNAGQHHIRHQASHQRTALLASIAHLSCVARQILRLRKHPLSLDQSISLVQPMTSCMVQFAKASFDKALHRKQVRFLITTTRVEHCSHRTVHIGQGRPHFGISFPGSTRYICGCVVPVAV